MTDRFITIALAPGVDPALMEVRNEDGQRIEVGKWTEHDGGWSLSMKAHPGLNNLADKIHQQATASGFWPEDKQRALEALDRLRNANQEVYDEDWAFINRFISSQEVRNMGEMLMLAVSELAEALEEHRDGRPVHYHNIKIDEKSVMNEETAAAARDLRMAVEQAREDGELDQFVPDPEVIAVLVRGGIAKPEGLAVELVDCLIRLLDTLGSLDVDIDGITQEKMTYNASRGFKHGKAY